MALEFDEELIMPAIPAAAALRARQAALIQRRISATSLDQVKAEALAAITNTQPGDEPSEEKRLRLLYQEAYTQEELEQFIVRSLLDLGFHD